MVVVVKRVRTTRPSLINQRNADSMTTMRTDGGKSESSSSLKSNTSRSPSSKSCRVCFALDYNVPDEVVPSPGVLSEKEIGSCFYSVRQPHRKHCSLQESLTWHGWICNSLQSEDLKKFDKDRALTVLMYKARKNNGSVAWDDNEHSIRGLEEALSQRKDDKSRVERRREFIKAVLGEQERLKQTETGREELSIAAKALRKKESELAAELIRGVSCSLSKMDKQRAIGLALKDEKASGVNRGSAHRLLMKVTGKISGWVNTSSKSLMSASESDGSRT
jgi:hypothetical protein